LTETAAAKGAGTALLRKLAALWRNASYDRKALPIAAGLTWAALNLLAWICWWKSNATRNRNAETVLAVLARTTGIEPACVNWWNRDATGDRVTETVLAALARTTANELASVHRRWNRNAARGGKADTVAAFFARPTSYKLARVAKATRLRLAETVPTLFAVITADISTWISLVFAQRFA